MNMRKNREAYSMVYKYYIGIIVLISSTLSLNSQSLFSPSSKRLTPEANFSTFSETKATGTEELWSLYNSLQAQQHPEYGYLPIDGPKDNVIELLDKRTATYRQFVSNYDPAVQYQQFYANPKHYLKNGQWISIDKRIQPTGHGQFEAPNQIEPVGFNLINKNAYIKTIHGKINFNNWSLVGVLNGQEHLLAQSNWSNYTAGDDGIYIHDIFPGINLRMRVLEASLKSDFIIKSLEFPTFDYLIFYDQYESADQSIVKFASSENAPLKLTNTTGAELLSIEDAIVYQEDNIDETLFKASYRICDNTVGIILPSPWLRDNLKLGNVIVDPLVTASYYLAQSAITGSMYNVSCYADQSCDYVLNITTLPNSTITNVIGTSDYFALGGCLVNQGAVAYQVGTCVSELVGCGQYQNGLCYGDDFPFNGISNCLPAPTCTPVTFPLIYKFYRGCVGTPGCNGTCIRAGNNWSFTVQSYTLQFSSSNVNQQFSLSATTVCPGAQITATANVQYGVPPYNVNWSLSSSGSPSIGNGLSISTSLSNVGANTLYCFITDACGSTVNTSRTVTVTNPPTGPNVTTPVNYCIGANSIALTSPGSGLKWYTVATGGTPLTSAPIPSTSSAGTTSYWVTQTVSGCESQRSQIDVIVHSSPTVSGTPTITPSQCDIPTGSISGLSTTAPGPITYTWYNLAGDVLSTSTTSSTLNNQPGGEYSLMITDAHGCQGTQAGYTIPLDAAPMAPTVISPISYCHYDTALPLSAIGSDLIWYTDPNLSNGTTTAPTPNTNLTLTTNYFVTQTVNGCESLPAQIVVTVKPNPSLPTVTSPVTYCQFETPGALIANGTNLLWYTSSTGGTGSSTAPVLSTDNYSNSTFYVSQTVNGCEGARAPIQVNIIALPIFNGTPQITPSACDAPTGVIMGITPVASNSPLLTFQWYNENGNLVAGSLNLVNQPSGNYTLTAVGQNQCSSSYGPVFIPLVDAPAGPLAPSPVEYCMGYTAIPLTANGAGLKWYTVATGGTASNVAPTPSTQTVGSISYYVSQTVNGCESDRTEIVVNVLGAPGADFNVNAQIGCTPFCPVFQNLSTPTGAPIIDYEWRANSSVFSNSPNPTYCLQTGTYTIELKVTDAVGCTKTVTKNDFITVVPAPISHFSADKYEAPEHSSTITFQTANPKANETVVWNFGDGSTATGNFVSYPFPGPGRYCVTHTVTSNYGCSDRSERCVIITSEFNLYIPNSFTPGGDGINDVWKPILRGRFNKYSISIYNRWGERVFFSNDPEVAWVGDVQNGDYYFAPDGMYHYVIVIEDEKAIPTEYRGHIHLMR
jgi:gliding motility-associated-like protein